MTKIEKVEFNLNSNIEIHKCEWLRGLFLPSAYLNSNIEIHK